MGDAQFHNCRGCCITLQNYCGIRDRWNLNKFKST